MLTFWKCEVCHFQNDILTDPCKGCYSQRPNWVTEKYRALVEIRRGIYLHRLGDYKLADTIMTAEEELFAKFYNEEKVLVADMDIPALREHRDMLQKIAFEAKARLVAADDEIREKKAKSKNKEWLVSTESNQTETDAINAVETRKKRMSKMDKLREQLKGTLDDATIEEMIKNLERKATEADVNVITFKKPTVENAVVVVKKTKPMPDANAPAFDPTKLFGSK